MSTTAPRYRGRDFEFHVIDIASEIANRGVLILPRQSAPFRYSSASYHQHLTMGKGIDFEKQMGRELVCGTGIDTALATDQWKDTSILSEIVTVEFPDVSEEREA